MKEYPSNDKLLSAMIDMVEELDYADIGIIRDALQKAWYNLYQVDQTAPATRLLGDLKYGCFRAIELKLNAEAETFLAKG